MNRTLVIINKRLIGKFIMERSLNQLIKLWTYKLMLASLKLGPLNTICLLIWYNIKAIMRYFEPELNQTSRAFILRKYRWYKNKVTIQENTKTNSDLGIFYRTSDQVSTTGQWYKKGNKQTRGKKMGLLD